MKRLLSIVSVALLFPAMAWAQPDGQYDLGIESMRAHGYSVGVFGFMMLAIAVFVGIMIAFYRMGNKGGVKKGEKILFVMMGLGVVASSVFAAVQLLDGFLF